MHVWHQRGAHDFCSSIRALNFESILVSKQIVNEDTRVENL
jgi:hypothetical protein